MRPRARHPRVPPTGRSGLRLAVVLAILTTGNYLGWLGWDQRYDVDADGVVSGPYQPWQVVGLVAGLAALAGLAGWRRHPEVARTAIPAAMTLCFAVDAATDTNTYGASLWPVGAAMVAVGTLAGVAVVANLVAAWRHQRSRAGR